MTVLYGRDVLLSQAPFGRRLPRRISRPTFWSWYRRVAIITLEHCPSSAKNRKPSRPPSHGLGSARFLPSTRESFFSPKAAGQCSLAPVRSRANSNRLATSALRVSGPRAMSPAGRAASDREDGSHLLLPVARKRSPNSWSKIGRFLVRFSQNGLSVEILVARGVPPRNGP